MGDVQVKSEKKIVSFDFDNTIAITYIDFLDTEDPQPVFIEYNPKIISLIKEHIKNKDEVYIVTSRYRSLEEQYPNQDVPYHLKKLGLEEYFWPDRVFYMDGGLKTDKLAELNVDQHYDDSMEELLACKSAQIPCKNPYDFYKDASVVAKAIIYDDSGKVLVLKRGDEGTRWDLPGGHIKEIELKRGEFGLNKGLEREVAEETGIILPNESFYYDFSNTFKQHTNQIHVFLSRLDEAEPDVDLGVQEFEENIDYHWVPISQIETYIENGTTVFREVMMKMMKDNKSMTNEEKYLTSQRKNWRKMKTKLIGMGKNKHTGGGKGHTRPNMNKGKAAPPDFAVLETKEDKKKVKIKVKIVKNEESLDEKRKKRKKRRKKSKKRHSKAGIGGYYPYYDLYDAGSGDSGGGDGGGGE